MADYLKPTLIIYNAHVLAFDKKNYSAIAIKDNKIIDVGTDKEILYLKTNKTKIIDAKGKSVIPGFIDAHTHFISMGIGFLQVNLFDAKSKEEALKKLKDSIRHISKGEWLIGRGWDESRWPENEYITKNDLDAISSEIPIFLYRICGHLATVNSVALSILKLPKEIKEIDYKHGFLKELALEIAKKKINRHKNQLERGLRLALQHAMKLGVTSIHENITFKEFTVFQNFYEENPDKLTTRVYFLLWHTYLDQIKKQSLKTGWGHEFLRFGAIKLMVDGSVGAKTAAFFEPYVDDQKNYGLLLFEEEVLLEVFEIVNKFDIQLAIHAIGDRAIDLVLNTLKLIHKKYDKKYLRHRIEHFEFPTEEQLRLAKELNIIASMQPNFVANWGMPNGLYEKRLGRERFKRNNPFRRIIDQDIVIAFGSDCMPMNPIYGIWGAINHPIKESRLSIEEAIKAYTLNAAYASHEESIKGSIEPGKIADLLILSHNLNSIEEKKFNQIIIERLIYNGKVMLT